MCSTTKPLLHPVDFTSVPLPQEVPDLEEFLDRTTFKGLNEEERASFLPYLRELVEFPDRNKQAWEKERVRLRRKYRVNPRNSDLIRMYREMLIAGELSAPRPIFESHIKKKVGKSFSGIVSITVVMGPGQFSCPMDCHFCPNDPSISRSYLLKEPAVRRGFQQGWDAYNQFIDRASTLDICGHTVTKVELIVLGGTFGSYPHQYAEEFLRDCYFAANVFSGVSDRAPEALRQRAASSPGFERPRYSIDEEIEINQYARCAIIGVTLETRPDWINRQELLRFRKLGATRIQLGIQHLDDHILDIVNRRCPTKKTKKAIRLLKQNCFKVDGHFMPDLPGSSPEIDKAMFTYLFGPDNEDIQVDQMKVYPCMTLDYTEILKWYNEGKYHPYAERNDGKEMFDLLVWICRHVPYHIRLNRIVRDMPHDYIRGGINRVNMRQDLETYLQERGEEPCDIRGREVKAKSFEADTAKIFIDKYRSSEGDEYFISFENNLRTVLYGFIRLRLSDDATSDVFFETLKNAALIRELHVYGVLVHQDEDNVRGQGSQHLGIGTLLMSIAEAIAWEHGWRKMAIIAGVGVRDYYLAKGYRLEETFVVKDLHNFSDLVSPPAHFHHHFQTQPTPPVKRRHQEPPPPQSHPVFLLFLLPLLLLTLWLLRFLTIEYFEPTTI